MAHRAETTHRKPGDHKLGAVERSLELCSGSYPQTGRPKRGDVVGQLLDWRQALGRGVHQHDLALGQGRCVDEVQEQAGRPVGAPAADDGNLRRHVPSGLTDIASSNVTVPYGHSTSEVSEPPPGGCLGLPASALDTTPLFRGRDAAVASGRWVVFTIGETTNTWHSLDCRVQCIASALVPRRSRPPSRSAPPSQTGPDVPKYPAVPAFGAPHQANRHLRTRLVSSRKLILRLSDWKP